jgi:23S rRNA G2445 N2-methylase RlmL
MPYAEWKKIYIKHWINENREAFNQSSNLRHYNKLYGKDVVSRYVSFYNNNYDDIVKNIKIDALTGKIQKITKNNKVVDAVPVIDN